MSKSPPGSVSLQYKCTKLLSLLRILDTGLPLLDVVADIPSSAVSILVYIDCYGSRQDYCYWTVKGELRIPGKGSNDLIMSPTGHWANVDLKCGKRVHFCMSEEIVTEKIYSDIYRTFFDKLSTLTLLPRFI